MFRLVPTFFAVALTCTSLQADPITYWDETRTGANSFNEYPTERWFQDASEAGLGWIRLAYDKWDSAHRDFLIGNADNYEGLIAEDLALLRQALDWADAHDLKVVLAPLSLPGGRYRQFNGNQYDSRIWRDKAYWGQAAAFWRDMAGALKDHPAVVGYNILNEPAPELGTNLAEHDTLGDVSRFSAWFGAHKGTAADLYTFYGQVISAIREVDPEVPIMVDAGWYAQPAAFTYWPGPLADDHVLYAFHMYEPYDYTSQFNFKEGRNLSYPGVVPFAGQATDWNQDMMRTYLQPFFDWADTHGIPEDRIVAGEFGCYRRNDGCVRYLSDVLDLLEENSVHWAFYAFREDWDGYDFELGNGNLPRGYWTMVEEGRNDDIKRNPDTEMFQTLKARLAPVN
ncbi:glycosyl hydrolase (plasmid) [Phaeobacter inhibens]|uniref:glycoside hydrolase family 5 protein n=1 Tax=Phaeobacter inhibens TaxID=221822 RepID=UPI0009718FEF|nr:cellulase family glycosylhydrolase [Phaeobacter inhibens]APX18041.1 glycosyl hydrolase [Phaeobacter inhibens]